MYLFRHHKECLKLNKKNGSVRDYIIKYLDKMISKKQKKKKKKQKKESA